MEKELTRGIRRHHLERLKKNRAGYYGWDKFDSSSAELARHVGRVAHTARLCSCWMCGNPRKHLKEKTVKEQSHIETSKKFDMED